MRVTMNYYDALEHAARASGMSFNEIGVKLGHASNYIHNAKSRGSSPTVDNAARAAAACGWALALVPAGELPEGAVAIDPPERKGCG